jgi:hypothetical protein
MLSFAFKIAINATSLNALPPGVQKEEQFPALHHQKKNPHPTLLIFHLFKQKFSSLHSNLRSSILFETKELSFTSFFFGCWNLGLWRGGEGFVVVTSCCKTKFSLELLI